MHLEDVKRQLFAVKIDPSDLVEFVDLWNARMTKLIHGKLDETPKLLMTINGRAIEADAIPFGESLIVVARTDERRNEVFWAPVLVFGLIWSAIDNAWAPGTRFFLEDTGSVTLLPRDAAILAASLFR